MAVQRVAPMVCYAVDLKVYLVVVQLDILLVACSGTEKAAEMVGELAFLQVALLGYISAEGSEILKADVLVAKMDTMKVLTLVAARARLKAARKVAMTACVMADE